MKIHVKGIWIRKEKVKEIWMGFEKQSKCNDNDHTPSSSFLCVLNPWCEVSPTLYYTKLVPLNILCLRQQQPRDHPCIAIGIIDNNTLTHSNPIPNALFTTPFCPNPTRNQNLFLACLLALPTNPTRNGYLQPWFSQ